MRPAILALLAEQPMHGYQVIRELESRSGGAWRVSPGSVYPTLQLLEEEGLVTGAEVEGKRVFSLTEAGRAEVAAAQQRGRHAPWEGMFGEADDAHSQLRNSAFQLAAAAWQVGRAGSREQVTATVAILDEARRQVYALLAQPEAKAEPQPGSGS
ncbi:MAG: PadR family transcriptional regulator [Candidatus Dormibacteraeota bacterium]|nr:PadR family transcriptional regulator [Candidatus Dormibacteraeota bacterium]